MRRIGLGNVGSDDWTQRFSDLTHLYPQFHAQLLSPGGASQIVLAHALLIIHTFVEDRLRDGQMPDPGTGTSFSSVCLSEGLLQLQAAGVLTEG